MTPVSVKKTVTAKDSMKAEKVVSKPKAEEKSLHDGSSRGLTWGLKLHATLKRMFEENFKAKKTDDQLIAFLLAEFPNRENKNILYNMRECRWRYNVGELTKDKDDNRVKPEVPSVPYNADGSVKEKKTKPKMSEAEKLMKAEERNALELERRKEEIEQLAKAEERLVGLRKKITDRQTNWEAKYGKPTEAEAKKPEGKSKLKVVKAKK